MKEHTLEPRPITVEIQPSVDVLTSPALAEHPPARWRRHVNTAILVAVGAAILVVAQLARPAPSTEVGAVQNATGSAQPAPSTFPKLVVPPTARPGERLPVVAYEYRSQCGDIEVLLDGSPAPVQVTGVIDAPSPDWTGTVLALDLPATIAPGPHEVTLVGALPPRGVDACITAPRNSGRIASVTVVVSRPPSPRG
jgi:hypothetical protein